MGKVIYWNIICDSERLEVAGYPLTGAVNNIDVVDSYVTTPSDFHPDAPSHIDYGLAL